MPKPSDNLYYKLTITVIDSDNESEIDEMLVYNMRKHDSDAIIASDDIEAAMDILGVCYNALSQIDPEGDSNVITTQH